MTPKRFMLIAGEPSGDALGAELVRELRAGILQRRTYSTDLQPLQADLAPQFFGAGGARMAGEGVDLAFDLTKHSVIGLSDALKNYFKFRQFFDRLVKLALEREPHVIICIDYAGFNRRFAAAIKKRVRARRRTFNNWEPHVVQFVSPQVWASRENRARQIARDFDLLLSIFPFEKSWYAQRVPHLNVEFVGHPMIDRHSNGESAVSATPQEPESQSSPSIVLLPGSRRAELERHFPVILEAYGAILKEIPTARATVVMPDENLAAIALLAARPLSIATPFKIQIGGLAGILKNADLAIASTGTVTMECAYFGVPAVTLYKTSWSTYEIAKLIVKVKWGTMPNLLAGEEIFPEFIQEAATPKNIARAALDLLRDQPRRERIKARLAKIVATLGGTGATHRAAQAILRIAP